MADLFIRADAAPLWFDDHGALRIGAASVTLDVLLAHYRHGASAEEIARRFPVLTPAEVHAVLAYYLQHPNEIDAYLEDQARQASVVFDGTRDRLPAPPPVDYKPGKRPASGYTTATWQENDAYRTDRRLWTAFSIGFLVVLVWACGSPDPAGRFGEFLCFLVCSPPFELLSSASNGDVSRIIISALYFAAFDVVPVAAIGWLFQALALMVVNTLRKRSIRRASPRNVRHLVLAGLAIVPTLAVAFFLYVPPAAQGFGFRDFRRIRQGMTLTEVESIPGPSRAHLTRPVELDRDFAEFGFPIRDTNTSIPPSMAWSSDKGYIVLAFDSSGRVRAGRFVSFRPYRRCDLTYELGWRVRRLWHNWFSWASSSGLRRDTRT